MVWRWKESHEDYKFHEIPYITVIIDTLCLSVSFRILPLPVPAIPYHLIDPILRTPAKLTLGLRQVRVNDRNVAGTTAINDIRDLDAVHAFKSFHEFQNAVALPCSKVVHCEFTVVLDRLESVYVASGEVYDVDVVPDTGAIRCVIVVPENMKLLQLSRCNLSNTRPLMSLAIYRNQSIGVVKK